MRETDIQGQMEKKEIQCKIQRECNIQENI